MSRWAAFGMSLLLIAPLGWLVCFGLTLAVSERLLQNEDTEMLLYLFGLPLFVACSFAALSLVYRALYRVAASKLSIRRGLLLAPIIYYGLERGSVYGLFAPGYIQLSTMSWGMWVAGIWTVALLISGAVFLLGVTHPRLAHTSP